MVELPHILWTMSRMEGHYAPYFWVMISCVFAFPLGALIFSPVKRHWGSLLFVAVVINFGVWLNRYLLVVPAIIKDHTPFSSITELLLVVGLAAGFLWTFLLLFKVFPMISTWEMRDSAGEEGSMGFYFDISEGGTLRLQNQRHFAWRKVER